MMAIHEAFHLIGRNGANCGDLDSGVADVTYFCEASVESFGGARESANGVELCCYDRFSCQETKSFLAKRHSKDCTPTGDT